jgi:hypothetical protein
MLASMLLVVALPPAAARADAGPVAEVLDAGGAFLDRAPP